tara:strand:+ start:221 stop:664 length:444 start_codon:yes stop_codon:yes gene_type:complete
MIDDEFLDVNGEPHGTSVDEIVDGIENYRLDSEQFDNFPEEMWKEEDVIHQCVVSECIASWTFPYIHESMWRDKDFVLRFLSFTDRYNTSEDIYCIGVEDLIHESIKNDKDVIKGIDLLRTSTDDIHPSHDWYDERETTLNARYVKD